MENYGYLIDSYKRFGRALEDLVIKDLVSFVASNGVYDKSKDRVTLYLNYQETKGMLPHISVPIYDSSEHDKLYATLDRLYVEKAGDNLVRLWYGADEYSDSIAYVDMLGILNIHSVLKALEDGEYEDLRIDDGKIVVKK